MYRAYMGPRGRMHGRRDFLPEVFFGVIGLIFFGWIILAAIGGVIGAGIMILRSVFSTLAHVLPGTVRSLFSGEGFALGVALGMVWYLRTHRRNAQKETPRAEASRSGGAIDETPVQTEVIEAPVYRTFDA